MGPYFVARFLSFIFFKLNSYPLCDLRLMLDTNVFLLLLSVVLYKCYRSGILKSSRTRKAQNTLTRETQ